MTFAAPVQGPVMQPVVSLSRSSSYWGIALWRPRSGILAPGSGSCMLSMTSWASSQMLVRGEELTARLCRHFHSKREIHHRALLHPLAIYWEKNHGNKKDHKQTRDEGRPMRC